MFFLVVIALIGAAASEPQHLTMPMGYGIMAPGVGSSVFPIPYSTVPAASIHAMYPSTVHSAPASAGIIPAASIPAHIPYGSSLVYPSLDITMARSSMMMPKMVEDTPEVKKAKMEFEMAYNKAMMQLPESTPMVRAKRDVTRVMPYGYNLPYSGYVTPYGQFPGAAIHSSPVLPPNVLHAPYFSHV